MAPKLILLIDHEISVREILQVCLSELGGWNVTLAESFQEVLSTLSRRRPDAILLDVNMPENDGLTFVQRLRTNPLTHGIPIVFVTAKARWFTSNQLQDLGAVGAIAKPFDVQTLPAQIATLLGWSTGQPSYFNR